MSKNALLYVAVGAAYILGAATAILLVKDRIERKYRKRADEEVESVKEAFARRSERGEGERVEEAARYSGLIAENGYRPEEEEPEGAVYISPDEYGDDEDYEAYSIDYYEGDGVFEDEAGEVLEDEEWEAMLGCGVAKHFGKYEDDRVCVRNDARRAYYEVLRNAGRSK